MAQAAICRALQGGAWAACGPAVVHPSRLAVVQLQGAAAARRRRARRAKLAPPPLALGHLTVAAASAPAGQALIVLQQALAAASPTAAAAATASAHSLPRAGELLLQLASLATALQPACFDAACGRQKDALLIVRWAGGGGQARPGFMCPCRALVPAPPLPPPRLQLWRHPLPPASPALLLQPGRPHSCGRSSRSLSATAAAAEQPG